MRIRLESFDQARRSRSMCAAAVAMIFMLAISRLPGAAQGDTGQISIFVTDAATKSPLSLARVLLDGPVITSELSGPDGRVVFTDVPSGIYRARVGKNGYSPVTSAQFEILEGKSVTVDVALAKNQNVKSLGTIVVRSTATVGGASVNESSAVRKLSDTLADALNKLSGVTLSTDPNGGNDASETVSLEGHDPTQTMLSVDGIPLNAPGVAGDLRQINTDLFSGASVSQGPAAGALGGSVNFNTLQPTLTWQGRVSQSFGTFDKASSLFTAQGTAGGLGIAFVHSIRGGDNPLTGQRFLDASGLDYVHSGGSLAGGDLVKLRSRLGESQTLTGTFMSANNDSDSLCTVFSGPVPCGYGPGNFSFRHFSFASLSDSALLGEVGVQMSLFGTNSSFERNMLNRFVNGIADPFGSDVQQSSRGASVNAVLPSRERHTISIQAATTSSSVNVTPLTPSSRPFAGGGATQLYSLLTLNDKINSTPTLTLNEHLGLSSASNAGSSILGGLAASWNPNPNDALSASVDVGGANPGPARVGVLTDPANLRFECDVGLAFGNGPGDAPGRSSSNSQRLTWQHKIRSGQFTTTLYRQVQNDILISTFVNGATLPASYFPPAYFTLAQQIFQSPLGCGSAAPFGPANLYVTQPVGNSQDLYEGVHLSGGFSIGERLVVEPYYDIQIAKVLSGDARLTNPASITFPGAQLPSVPMHRAGVTLDYRAPHSLVETLFDANYVSANNANNLPAYVTADAGASIGLQHGTLTVAATNLFDVYGTNYFSTPQNAVPYITAGGIELPTLSRPLSPRQYSVTYSVRFGEGAGSAPVLPLVTPQTAGSGVGGGRGGFGGGGGGGFGGGFAALPNLSAPVSSHPLDPDATRQSCTADAAKSAKPTFDAFKAYVAAIEGAKTQSGYPQSAPANLPDVPGVAIGYHSFGPTYALAITPTQFSAIGSLLRCAPLHIGSASEAQAAHLYVPQGSAFFRLPIVYSPAAGLYAVRLPQQAGREQFRLYRLPSSPPAAPFAIVKTARCTTDLQPTAVKLLAALQSYVSSYNPAAAPPSQPAGWAVLPHTTAKGYWLQLTPSDISGLPAVLNCAHVATADKAEIVKLGLDGAGPPALNFAPSLGLYLLRPNRPPQGD